MASCYEVIAIEKALDASCHSIFHPESTNEHLSIDYLYLQIGLNKCCCQIWHNNLVRYHRIWCIFHSWQKSRINVVVLVAKIQVQPVSFCLKIFSISRLPIMGNCCEANICYEISRLPLSIHSCQNFKCHSKWNQYESKILKKRNGTWIPARHPCQLSQNLLAILTMSQRVAVTNHNHLILAPKMSWPSLEHSFEAKICREFSKIAISKNFKNAIELKPPIYC